jgi:hypothetical protein
MPDEATPRKVLTIQDIYERSDKITRRLLNLVLATNREPDILHDEYLRALAEHVRLMDDVRAELNRLHERLMDYMTRDTNVTPINPAAK